MDIATIDWATIVTSGGFGALVWYFVVKHIPSIEERHREERLEFLAYIRIRDTIHDAQQKSYQDAILGYTLALTEVHADIVRLREDLKKNSEKPE